jgi:hypothetical protein
VRVTPAGVVPNMPASPPSACTRGSTAAQPVQAVAWDAEAFRWALKKIRAQGVCNDEQAMLERFSAMSSQKGA